MEIAESVSFKYYIENHCEHELLTKEQEVALSIRAMKGDEAAVEELVLKNQQFVVHIAKRYLGFGLPIEDLVQEGNIGLITAARKFNHAKGFRFITYAVWWVRQALQRYTACEGGCVKLPAGTVQLYKKAKKVDDEHRRKFNSPAGYTDLLKALGSPHNARAAEVLLSNYESLNVELLGPIAGTTGLERVDLLQEEGPSPEEQAMRKLTLERINDFLDKKPATKRSKSVMSDVYGLDGNVEKNLQAIANKEGCCRERVRQVKEKTLRSMRSRRFLNAVFDAETAQKEIGGL